MAYNIQYYNIVYIHTKTTTDSVWKDRKKNTPRGTPDNLHEITE